MEKRRVLEPVEKWPHAATSLEKILLYILNFPLCHYWELYNRPTYNATLNIPLCHHLEPHIDL